jgi:hypothetical protein
MSTPPARWAWTVLALGVLAGCGRGPAQSPDTGAADAARGYYEAVLRQDWARAYAALGPEARARWSAAEFTRRARAYRRKIGFDPEAVRVRACEEDGPKAIAHVLITGRAGGRQRVYKDAITLRQSGIAWGVVLPRDFGRQGRR